MPKEELFSLCKMASMMNLIDRAFYGPRTKILASSVIYHCAIAYQHQIFGQDRNKTILFSEVKANIRRETFLVTSDIQGLRSGSVR
jgi:hypothetical protein